MNGVLFRGVSKRYGHVTALDALDLEIPEGAFVSLLGPSGSGKSTTLNLLAGLLDADAGEILIGGRPVTHLPPERRDIAMVFQNYALYPHLTVAENIAFPLEARRPRPAATAIAAKVEAVAETLSIGTLLARYPKEISGGQQQRVALARAMVRDPKVFLLDEPLSNLDARLRIRMRRDLKALHARLGSTIVYVTHDQAEAMALSDLVAVFDGGRLQQISSPSEVYDQPANLFVAGFVGDREINLLDGVVHGGVFEGKFGRTSLNGPVPGPDRPLRLAVRPEAVTLVQPADAALTGTVVVSETGGADLYITLHLRDGTEVVARTDPRAGVPGVGQAMGLVLDQSRVRLFEPTTGILIQPGP